VCIALVSTCSLSHTLNAFSFSKTFAFWATPQEEIVTHKQVLTAKAHVTISNTKGNITITTWPKQTMLVEATKKGSEEELRLTKIETLYTKDGASIKTVALKPSKLCTVDYDIVIPQNATITLAQTDKGDITISNVTTPIKAHSEYGALTFLNITNSLQASTKYGPITIETNALKPASHIIAMAEKGTIKMQLPTNTNATLYAKTNKGIVTSDHAITLEPRTLKICQSSIAQLRKDVRGSLGHGGSTTIKLHTSRGNVKVLEA
jgi:hypothetical protein